MPHVIYSVTLVCLNIFISAVSLVCFILVVSELVIMNTSMCTSHCINRSGIQHMRRCGKDAEIMQIEIRVFIKQWQTAVE